MIESSTKSRLEEINKELADLNETRSKLQARWSIEKAIYKSYVASSNK